MSSSIVVGGGCFWCLEAVFQQFKGVQKVRPGYAGGETPHPSYREVCTGTTGHAEVVEITYDTNVISEEQLLDIFWHAHDPTTLNRQGNDVGTQYRSILLYRDEDQHQRMLQAKQAITEDKLWADPIVTEIAPLTVFYEAESYHHKYYEEHPRQPYCSVVIAPKVAKIKERYNDIVYE